MAKLIDLDPQALGLAPDDLFTGNSEWEVTAPNVKYTENGALRFSDLRGDGGAQGLITPTQTGGPYAGAAFFLVADVIQGPTLAPRSPLLVGGPAELHVLPDGSLVTPDSLEGPDAELWPADGGIVLISYIFTEHEGPYWEYHANGVLKATGDVSHPIYLAPHLHLGLRAPNSVADVYRLVIIDDLDDYASTHQALMEQYIDPPGPVPPYTSGRGYPL